MGIPISIWGVGRVSVFPKIQISNTISQKPHKKLKISKLKILEILLHSWRVVACYLLVELPFKRRRTDVDDYIDYEIELLHEKLAAIYRRGRLTPTEEITVQGLWARIERLQTSRNKVLFRDLAQEQGRNYHD